MLIPTSLPVSNQKISKEKITTSIQLVSPKISKNGKILWIAISLKPKEILGLLISNPSSRMMPVKLLKILQGNLKFKWVPKNTIELMHREELIGPKLETKKLMMIFSITLYLSVERMNLFQWEMLKKSNYQKIN